MVAGLFFLVAMLIIGRGIVMPLMIESRRERFERTILDELRVIRGDIAYLARDAPAEIDDGDEGEDDD
jgi:hypothetical protein